MSRGRMGLGWARAVRVTRAVRRRGVSAMVGGGVGLFWGAVVSCADGEGVSLDDLVCDGLDGLYTLLLMWRNCVLLIE